MARKVLSGLIQASNPINDETKSVAEIQAAMLEKHLPMIHEAGKKGVQIICLQEIFNGPYFCPGQDKRWYDALKISCRQRIWTPFLPASWIIGRCFSSIA